MKFIGRKKELEELNLLRKKSSASLVVIRGRRRIGKSRLIHEFTEDKKSLIFSGLPPVKGMTRQRQINTFAIHMSQRLKMPKVQTSEWSELFWHLGNQLKNQKIVVVFDEISWMGSSDPDFLGHLKNLWDLHFSRNPKLIFILCGSISSWIEENILSSTGFLGRVSVDMVLDELPLSECQEFWKGQKNKVSAYEKFKVLSVTGGVPKYLEEIIPEKPAEANIRRMCFQSEGLLYREYDQIFSDLFSKKSQTYSNIINTLSHGALEIDQICQKLQIEKSGAISSNLHNLILAGFIAEDASWNIKNKKASSMKRFRLRDNYLRFYLRYIAPNKDKIAKNLFDSSLDNLPGWETIMGFQFENLVLNNFKEVCQLLKIDIRDIVMAGPFFQRKTKRKKGCQIDLLIQTRQQTLYLCEIKFYASEIKSQVIEEVKEKIERLSYPRGFSIRPVLIHVNGVSRGVKNDEMFSQIIDFSSFFN